MKHPFIQSTEIEFAFSARQGPAQISPGRVHELLLKAIRRQVAWLPDIRSEAGVYLQNGGRFYLDTGGHGEYAAPECSSPAEVARFDKAGELLLALARAQVLNEHPGMSLTVAKNNVNPGYAGDATWGNHESHTCRVSAAAAAAQLIPHLVSRVPYAGAGCLSGRPFGCGFEWSQRAAHIVQAVSSETTSGRAIFCTRIRFGSDSARDGAWWRAHLIVKDSQRLPLGIYLTFGVTGLLFCLMNQGITLPGERLKLAQPVQALQQISHDRELRSAVPLADRRRLTPLAIQREYLEACLRLRQRAEFPEWGDQVLDVWGSTLDALERDPRALADRLDGCLKLTLFEQALSRAGAAWSDLHEALRVLTALRKQHAALVPAILAESGSQLAPDQCALYDAALQSADVRRVGVERLRLAARLQALDLDYHRVGEGIFEDLAAGGQLDLSAATPDAVAQALRAPPEGTRAAARGRLVQERTGESGWTCDWTAVTRPADPRSVSLADPFSPTAQPRSVPEPPTGTAHRGRTLTQLLRQLIEPEFDS